MILSFHLKSFFFLYSLENVKERASMSEEGEIGERGMKSVSFVSTAQSQQSGGCDAEPNGSPFVNDVTARCSISATNE